MSGTTDAAITTPRLSTVRRRQIALIGLSVGQLLTILDATAVNVALPSIQKDLNISQASLSWIVNAYLLTFGGCLLVAGRRAREELLVDRPGRAHREAAAAELALGV